MLIGYCFTPYRQYFSQITAATLECIKHFSKYNFIQQVLTKQKKRSSQLQYVLRDLAFNA